MKPYQQNRIQIFLNPDLDPLGKGYHIIQSKIAIGSGGLKGNGFLEGSQSSLNFLPEKQTDFVFAIFSEQFGFTGSILLILLFFIMFLIPVLKTFKLTQVFNKIILFVLSFKIFFEFLINISMTIGILPVVGVAFPFIAYFMLYGGPGLSVVATNKWGGLLVTLFLGVTGIALAFPLSILLALGRRSNMPIVKSICVVFIEFIRGVPLITLLFTANVMLPLFLPEGVKPDNLLRALVAVTLFQSAYMAEAIRGGLQAIPKGQIEAAQSLGLNYWQTTRKIILPQALKIAIPPIVNTCIGLFKDTSLVLIIGLFDLLGIGRAALSDITWTKLYYEVYVFVSLIFFIFCFGMSRYSLYLEKKLKTDNS